MPNTLLPGNTECFSLEPPATNLDEYGFFSYYDPNSKPCTFQQEFYRKKYFLDERVGAATGISRSSVVVHGGLVLDIVDELMNEYARKLENDEEDLKTLDVDAEDPLFKPAGANRRNYLTSANIHNAWLKKTLENIEDAQHDELSMEKDDYENHNHAISDCLSNQLFQLDLLTRKWHHVPTFLEDFGPLLKPRMCQSIVCDNEFLYMSGGLIPVNKSELKSLTPIKSVLSTHTSASDITGSSHSSNINEDQLLLATNELWRLDITSKIFLCINDGIDNSNIPERYNHQMHAATFIERFEVDEKYEKKMRKDEKLPFKNNGKIININGKKYIEKMVQKLILVGGLGIDDQEILKIDVFNLETQQWESGAHGPYKDLTLEFPFTTEFETSVVLDNPLTGESNIIIYKKDALNPLQVIPLVQRNTYDIDGHIIPELSNYYDDKLEEASKVDTIRINSQKFDEKLRFLNRRIVHPKMRIFGPNLLISGYCSESNKELVLKDHPDNKMIPLEELLPDEFCKKRLAILDKHTEKNLVYKTFCFSLVNGKWIEINCKCLNDQKCEHHMLSEVFVWTSHHKLLFIGSSDYQKHPKTSTIGLNRLSPILQKFDLLVTTSLNVTSLFHKISVITNEEESFKKAQRLFFSSQDHDYTLLNYLTFSTSHSVGSISNNDIKRFKEFAEYSSPVSDLTANQSIMPPYSMLLGKTLFKSYGVQISDFEIIPSDGDPVPCCLGVLRKRWGRYFDSLLAHGYIESINNLDEHTPSNDGSKFSSISSAGKKKNSLLPYLQKEKSKGSTSSSLKNSFSLNVFSDQVEVKTNPQPPQFNFNYSDKYSEQPLSQNVSPHDSKLNVSNLNNEHDTAPKKFKNHNIFKNEFLSNSLNDVGKTLKKPYPPQEEKKDTVGEPISEENTTVDVEGDPLSRSRTADDVHTASRRGSVLSRETYETQTSKPQTLTSSSGGMVFRVPFHTNSNSVSSEPVGKVAAKNNNSNFMSQTRHESISSQVKRLSETRRKSLTSSSHLGDTPRNSRTQSINSDYNKSMTYILPDIEVDNLPKIAKKPDSKPVPPTPEMSNNQTSTINTVYNNLNLNSSSPNMVNRRRLSTQKDNNFKRGITPDDSNSSLHLNSLHKGLSGRRRSSVLSNFSDTDKPNISFNEKLIHNLGSISSAATNSAHNSISVDNSLDLYNEEDTNTTINQNKSSFSTINEYTSKKGSISSSQRSQSIATEESSDSIINAELEPLMIPRSLYLPWSHESVAAFTEFFYTGQINPKWSFQPVALDVFLMAKLYEVPLLYDAMSEVFYSLIGRKEEYIYILKDKIDQKFRNCVKKYLKATNSDESVESYLNRSKKYQKFKDLDKPLQNIDYGYCDYSLLKNASTVLDLKEEELFEIGSSLNYKYSLPETFSNRINSINYPVAPSKNSEFNYQSKRDLYTNSEYSGVSPKSSISKNINHSNSNNGLDLKITAMKKNSLNKFQLYNSEMNKNSVSSDTAENYVKLSDLKDSSTLESPTCKNSNNHGSSYPQLFSGFHATEPLRSPDSTVSYNNELLFTELDDLLTDEYDFTTSSSSDSSEPEYDRMNRNFGSIDSVPNTKSSSIGDIKSEYGGSGTVKSDNTTGKKVSASNYGFGLISPAKINEKIENDDLGIEIGLDTTMKKDNNQLNVDNTINEFVNSVMSDDAGNNKKPSDPKSEDFLFGNKAKSSTFGSVTLEKLSSYEFKSTIEFIIEMIYEVSTHCYDLMLSIRSRNCLELCKMYKKVIKEINIEISMMDKKMSDIRHHRSEAQKAQVAQTLTNLPQGSPNIAPRSSATTNDSSTMNSSRINISNSNKNRDVSVKRSMNAIHHNSKANFDIISNSNNNTDNTSISSSTSSAKSKRGRFFSRNKNSNPQVQDGNNSISSEATTPSASKKTVLDTIKPLKPKRSISILNLFKKKS